jgi:DeoR/GlpR family transcriptional regulator of sugar metabolism
MAMTGTRMRRGTRARHDALVELMRTGVGNVPSLAARVGVSPSTLRRDLTQLQRDGRIARTYGGGIVRDVFQELSFSESALMNKEAKAKIAAAAAKLIPASSTIFLDAGTTCLALARALTERGPVTVVTRGLEAAALLSRAPQVNVVMLGGHVRPLSHGVVGPLTSLAFERLAFDVAFLGADAVDPVRGLGEPTAEETYVKERAASRASEVVLLADVSKLGPANIASWIPIPPSWTLITDSAVTPATVEAFEQEGIQIITAG